MADILQRRLLEILAPLFPNNALIPIRSTTDSLRFAVSWKLNNDSTRPNKRSRRIILVVPQEILEDYRDGDEGDRNTLEKRIVATITDKLRCFNPEHQTTCLQPEPKEEWLVG